MSLMSEMKALWILSVDVIEASAKTGHSLYPAFTTSCDVS